MAKVDVLINYWDKIFGYLQKKASMQFYDKNMNSLLKKIIVIDPQVRYEILRRYVKKCRELHSIAFMQWRKMYPTRYVDLDITEELILARINNLINGLKLDQMPLPITVTESKVSNNYLDKY